MSASIACNDEPYVICQTCESEMTTEQLQCIRCCSVSLPETCLSHEPTCIPEDVPIPLSARRKPNPINLVASAPPKQEKAPDSSYPTPTSEKRPDPVITKPRQTIWLDSPDTPLNTLAEICSRNLPALLPQPAPYVAPVLDRVAADKEAILKANEKVAAEKRSQAEQIKARVLNAEKEQAEQKYKTIVECSKNMWKWVILEFTKVYTTEGMRTKCSYAKWKAECKRVLDECKSRTSTAGSLGFYRSSFISVRNNAVSYFGAEWVNRCIDLANTEYQDSIEVFGLTPLPNYTASSRPEVRTETSFVKTRKPVPLAEESTPSPKYTAPKRPEVRVDTVPVKIKTMKPVPSTAELPWATPGSSLLVFFTDKWLKATFVANVQSGYKFAFADNTECVVTNADVLWRVMTFEQFATVQPPADKKRKLEIMIAEKEEMELQHAALKKKVAVFELKMTEKKEMIAQLKRDFICHG